MNNNIFSQDNVVRFFSQFDINCPKDEASLKEWISKNRGRLTCLADRNIFWIHKDQDGKQRIKLLGYIYRADSTANPQDKNWVHVQFMWYEMPLANYLEADFEDRSEWECEIKQLYSDHTEDNALMILVKEYAPQFILEEELNDKTPEGVYVVHPSIKEKALFINEKVFGDDDEHQYEVVCYDGYAIATAKEDRLPKRLELTYPLMKDILADEEKSSEVLAYRGLFDLKPHDIHYGDIMLAFGKIVAYTS